MSEILLSSYFGLDHTSSFEIIHTEIDDHRYRNVYCFITIEFCSGFKLSRTFPLLKVAHACQNFLEQNSKASQETEIYFWKYVLYFRCVLEVYFVF